jgi:ABC-type antimicrobial peptide transport system permease subunit
LFGGVAGVVIGIAAAYMLPNIVTRGLFRAPMPGVGRAQYASPVLRISYAPYINPFMVVVSFALAVVISVLSSLYPAWRAAKMDPVRALRYE